MTNKPISLYLHIPFCQHRCAYCDFNTYISLGDLKADYAAALADEVRQVGEMATAVSGQPLSLSTIFFGGGTPSLLAPSLLGDILSAVREAFHLAPGQVVEPHSTPSSVLVVVVSGTGTFRGDRTEALLGPGQAAIFEPGETHGIEATDGRLHFLAVIAPRPGGGS